MKAHLIPHLLFTIILLTKYRTQEFMNMIPLDHGSKNERGHAYVI